MFFRGSRYEDVETLTWKDPGGRLIRYKDIRLIPPSLARMFHTVAADERLDHIAHRYYTNPELFWRICDANHELWPEDLVEVGRLILIPPVRD